MNYIIKRYAWNLENTSYVTQVMGIDGMFYIATNLVPKLASVAEARTFFAENAYRHHSSALRDCLIEGPRGGTYRIS